MRPFTYERADDVADATLLGIDTGQGEVGARTQFLAGGTTLLDLMKLDVLVPERVVDLDALRGSCAGIEVTPSGLRLGAAVTMSAAARHPEVLASYPVIADSLRLAASPQIRNMATLGGNVLQRTRCPYFRDPRWTACNKRVPGSGCTAMSAFNRNHAILGVDETCISQYPGDFGVALVALRARVEIQGPGGQRAIEFADLHRDVGGEPHKETTLEPGEIITAFIVPAGGWTRRSLYLKIRDRASYEFALASVAVALELDASVVRTARIGLGGMAYRPWRSLGAEAALVGQPLTEDRAQIAADIALRGAVTHGFNDFKPELARRTIVRALMEAMAMPLSTGGS